MGSECGGSNPAVRLGGCTVIGAGIGAVGGAILTGGSPVGVVGGAVAGGVIGNNM
jgi:osmotically inducible lipoprotein OsmB